MAAILITVGSACDGTQWLGYDGTPCVGRYDEECEPGPDRVAGTVLTLNGNGGWSWFQDERAIYDVEGQNLVVSSVTNHWGEDGQARDADVEVTTVHLPTGRRTRVVLANLPVYGAGDDHNVAALWQRPDGRYLAMYTGHLLGGGGSLGDTPQSFYRITTNPHDGSCWGPEQTFTWPSNDVNPPIDDDVTYSNLLYLASEDRLYNIARAADRTPNIMVSDDWGESWSYAGKLTMTSADGQGGQYSNGYFKFSSNGVDRFDFIATEHHPHNFNTSIYHGYVSGGRSYDAWGNLVDDDIFDEVAPAPAMFTPVWTAAEETSTSYHHGWTVELERDTEGGLHALFTTRYGTTVEDHRLFYARFDGVGWSTTEIASMGGPLYPAERDYTGLGAIVPNDPSTIYISTPVDPRDGSQTEQHEIYRGVTRDQGVTWTWTPITWSSTVDNLRPIIPSWNPKRAAVLWLRGSYPSQRRYDLKVVGIID